MSEHGWPDFHDDGLHHDDGGHDGGQHDDGALRHDDAAGLAPHDDDQLGLHDDPAHDDAYYGDDAAHLHHEDAGGHDDGAEQPHEPAPDGEPQVPADGHDQVGADPDALAEPEAVGVFPPVLDVGPLPEPVDGFPWIDTGSLGLVDPAAVHAGAGDVAVSPQELADYAGTELAPGADPWAELAGSEDPATAALAKWWSENS